DRAREDVRSVYKLAKKSTSVPHWTLAELLWTDAAEQLVRKSSKGVLDAAARASELFSEVGIVPTAVLPPSVVPQSLEKYSEMRTVTPRNAKLLTRFSKNAAKVIEALRLD